MNFGRNKQIPYKRSEVEAASVCLLFTLAKHIPSRSKLPSTHQSPQAAGGFRASRSPAENTVHLGGLGFWAGAAPPSAPNSRPASSGAFPLPLWPGLLTVTGEADENLPSPAQTPSCSPAALPDPQLPKLDHLEWGAGNRSGIMEQPRGRPALPAAHRLGPLQKQGSLSPVWSPCGEGHGRASRTSGRRVLGALLLSRDGAPALGGPRCGSRRSLNASLAPPRGVQDKMNSLTSDSASGRTQEGPRGCRPPPWHPPPLAGASPPCRTAQGIATGPGHTHG